MVRAALIFALFGSLSSMAQSTEVFVIGQAICGPVGVRARMMDSSYLPVKRSQAVRITLDNLNSQPIVRERITLHYSDETPTSGAPSEVESRVEVGARQEAVLAHATSTPNPVSYVEVNSVEYADGSSWRPDNGTVCKTVPDPLQK